MTKAFATLCCATLTGMAVAAPDVSGVSFSERGDELVVNYTLSEDAIVVVDIQTNVTDDAYVSIGGERQWTLAGDVNRRVNAGARSFAWTPSSDLPDCDVQPAKVKVRFSVYADGTAPDYMVVDLSPSATDRVRYYPNVESLPGGLLSNGSYRASKIVMRHIYAKDAEWVMGSVGEGKRGSNESAHRVTFTNDYWMAVFEMTFTQASRSGSGVYRNVKPHKNAPWNVIRGNASQCSWPAKPSDASIIGKLRTATGVSFDLPSEAQWEFACRAGNGEGLWNDGSLISTGSENLERLAWFGKAWSSSNETACRMVGSFAPNSWGLYDMHGNNSEFCLDWYQADIAALGGRVNSRGASCADGTTAGAEKVVRGGSFTSQADGCRSARRDRSFPDRYMHEVGYRLCSSHGFTEEEAEDSL